MKKFILLLLLLTGFYVSATEVHVVGNESMPFNGVENGINQGVCVDILNEITKQGGPTFKFELGLPWKRAQLETQEERNKMIIPLTRTESREPLYTWVVPLVPNQMRITAADPSKLPKTVEAAKNLKVGVIRASAIIPELKKMGFTNISEANDGASNMKKLATGRVDIVIETELVDSYQWASIGEDPNKLLGGPVVGGTKQIFLGANKNFDPKVVEEIRAAMDKMIANGKLQEIVDKWK